MMTCSAKKLMAIFKGEKENEFDLVQIAKFLEAKEFEDF